MIYGLVSAPLTATDLQRLSATQRKMLRLMVGYSKLPGETWEDMYRRLKIKLANATQNYDVADWADALLKRKQSYLTEVTEHKRCGLLTASWLHSLPEREADLERDGLNMLQQSGEAERVHCLSPIFQCLAF